HAEEYSRDLYDNKVNYVYELMRKYDPVTKVFVDGANVDFVSSLKELEGEEADYQKALERNKGARPINKIDPKRDWTIVPINFRTDNVEMLYHLRWVLENGYLAI